MKFGIRELILVSMMIGLLICSYLFVFVKANEKRAALDQQTAAMRTKLTNLSQATAGIDDLGSKIDELQRAIDFFEKKLPAEKEFDKILKEAGFDWREAGCSMCLGMNPDQLKPRERCASTSNRNFEGRQGRLGRTHLVSPAMAAAAAIAGHFVDVRTWH